jgi:hypothetical protein
MGMEGMEMMVDVVEGVRAAATHRPIPAAQVHTTAVTSVVLASAAAGGATASLRALRGWAAGWAGHPSVLFLGPAQLVLPRGIVIGHVAVARNHLFFFGECVEGEEEKKNKLSDASACSCYQEWLGI